MVLQTLRNTTVNVTVSGDHIFFNNARVQSTALYVSFLSYHTSRLTFGSTNNGVIYVLDKILARDPAPAQSADPTPSTSPSPSPKNNAADKPSTSRHFSLALILGGIFALL
jgi:hypothetical protein